jgi:hypothetical protein
VIAVTGAAPDFGRRAVHKGNDQVVGEAATLHAIIVELIA